MALNAFELITPLVTGNARPRRVLLTMSTRAAVRIKLVPLPVSPAGVWVYGRSDGGKFVSTRYARLKVESVPHSGCAWLKPVPSRLANGVKKLSQLVEDGMLCVRATE